MKPRVRLVLVGTEGNINLGFAARVAANFAVDELYLVAPKANPKSDEALRYAVKAKDLLLRAVIVDNLSDALKGVEVSACTSARVGYKTDVLRNPITPRKFAEIAARYNSVAVVFGRESVGLTRDELYLCDILVTIPANPEYPVLNLTHAVAIVLYELWLVRSKTSELDKYHPEASAEALSRISELAEKIANIVIDEQRREHVVAAIKHCLAKAGLTVGEASNIYYLFKKIYHMLERMGKGRGGD